MPQSELTSNDRTVGETPSARNALGRDYRTPEHHDAPKLEPWLVVSLLAILPMLVAFAIPKPLVVYTAAISGILLVIGLAMLIVQERRRR
jgi:hypothetical protein